MNISLAQRKNALTLIEAVIVLGLIVILAALVLPAFHTHRGYGNRAYCVSNIKQVGLAWLLWINDHESSQLPFRVPVTNGGTFGSMDPLRNTAWWQYSILSNQMNGPEILVCPADKTVGLPRRVATNWSSSDTHGGFLSVGFRNRATSYTIGLDAIFLPQGQGGLSEQVLGSDRNIQFDGRNSECSSKLSEARFIRVKGKEGRNPTATAPWTNATHGLHGNVVCLDGSVHQTRTKELDALFDLSDDQGNIHFLAPN
jgi:hypothetical protein